MMNRALLLVVLAVVSRPATSQEAPPPIERYVAMIESGQGDPVRLELPALLARYPGNPGVLYLQALLTKEGPDAVRLYQSIVDNHPSSEWADDALHKIYLFYQAIGLYRTAELKQKQLKRDYPTSRYAAAAAGGAGAEPAPEPAPPAGQTQPATRPPAIAGQFTLQVGAYSTQVNANKQKLFFEDLGYSVEVINKVKDGRSLFSVNVGSYATYDDAKAKSAELKRMYNIDSFVVTR